MPPSHLRINVCRTIICPCVAIVPPGWREDFEAINQQATGSYYRLFFSDLVGPYIPAEEQMQMGMEIPMPGLRLHSILGQGYN